VGTHIQRALDLAAGVDETPGTVIDLGSGGGVPGVPLAVGWPTTTWTLLEGSTTRATFLEGAVAELEPWLGARVMVVAQRAEVAGRGPLRGTVDLVVARSFGSPGVTAECAAPLLRPGGLLVVAEPPGGAPARWDPAGLAELRMVIGVSVAEPTALQVLVQVEPCPNRFPRRVGVQTKRPLF
jgi:16S rRNA (guanine527-N7)-methyltransferase